MPKIRDNSSVGVIRDFKGGFNGRRSILEQGENIKAYFFDYVTAEGLDCRVANILATHSFY